MLLLATIHSPTFSASNTNSKPPSCGDLSSLVVGDSCQSTWSDLRDVLRPTQRSVGYAWVFRIQLKDMQSKGDAQDEMDTKVVPVTLGPDGTAYILDHHHHLAALDLSGHKSTKVTLFVSCNFSDVPAAQQLDRLAERGYAYLYGRAEGEPDALPTVVPASSLPATLAFRASAVTMRDDRWRALSGFSRKVSDGPVDCSSAAAASSSAAAAAKKGSKYCGRAYDRVCSTSGQSVPFFEYRWAYFFDAANADASLWPNSSAAAAFSDAYAGLVSPTPSAPVTSVDGWQAAADALVYLARGAAASKYELPSAMGTMAGKLPGYHAGLTPIADDDPDCDPPQCS